MSKASLSILLVEDHLAIARQVLDFLDGLRWQTDHAGTGALAVQLATRNAYDVVLLDLNLPDIDGLQVCRAIKAAAPSNVPVLMLTARDSYEDKARGFRDGADDYLTKPFDLREVALRCEALARRRQLHVRQEMRVGPFTLQTRAGRAMYRDAPLPLTQTGFKILLLLCREHPHAVSRSALLQALWGSQPPDSDALKSHIYALRKQLEQLGAAGVLVTIPQLGYRLAFDGAASDG
ncbi:DNA-binding response regulator [Janthinobacterium sp. BJB1]|uniref:response regulator transcription factor n=1 Tax=Janthinobacterium sp. GW458P TaxID=1981504 RepID=UPI000A329126|nr:response regulator transcription factor [Janthinobacterium sp. GW458P]MBE3025591.1 response regulator transcription factor [Janthinobacterium sp. GW458P]PHV14344.1 DNA-binding response regulator [Janthinobacterium sp. BJB303]PJD00335.1 DNA-binding response regulator [Janthinobacterium sp. BJB1]